MSSNDPITDQEEYIPFDTTTDQPNNDLLFKKPFPIPQKLKRTDSSTFPQFPSDGSTFPTALMPKFSQTPFLFSVPPELNYNYTPPFAQQPPPPLDQSLSQVARRERSPRRRDRSRSPRRRDRSPRRHGYSSNHQEKRQKFQEDKEKIDGLIRRYKQLSYMILNCDYQLNQLLDEGMGVNSTLFFSRLHKLRISTGKKYRKRELKVNGRARTWGIGDQHTRI